MPYRTTMILVLSLALLGALAACDDCDGGKAAATQDKPAAQGGAATDAATKLAADTEDGEQAVPLSEVPVHVLEAAKQAMPGFTPTRAEREVEHGVTVYDVVGTAGGKTWEIEVTAAGKVLEKELEDGLDDADDDGDDD